jgi:hypothetical protein
MSLLLAGLAIGYLVGFWVGHFVKFEQFPKWAQADLLDSGWYQRMKARIQNW